MCLHKKLFRCVFDTRSNLWNLLCMKLKSTHCVCKYVTIYYFIVFEFWFLIRPFQQIMDFTEWKNLYAYCVKWFCLVKKKLQKYFGWLKFIYSEKATKFFEISTLLLSVCTVDKSKVEISQNFVAFSEYTNFIMNNECHLPF